MNDHLPSVRVTIEDEDGHGALFITCRGEGCDYETGRERSRKQAWADFRAHARGGTTAQPETPPQFRRANHSVLRSEAA